MNSRYANNKNSIAKKDQQPKETVEDQEKRLVSQLETLMQKMDDFEMSAQAYKLNRLELTKKAIAFQLEKNRRLRDRNTVILKSGD